ncbi:MAG: hypothetical protein DRJ65_13750 [Acidobacteria bacterium]|nr:MAG: hypothetical protein DRJ65_13750 [Acidobacteriota bacterium]
MRSRKRIPTPAFWHALRAHQRRLFLRARSEVSDAKTTRARRKDEWRPTAVSRDSIADGVAERCQVSAFFATTARVGGLPGEESRTRHAPSEVFGALVRRGGR